MPSKIISITLSADLLQKINDAAKTNYCSRSDFIRESIVLRLHNQRVVQRPSEDDFLQQLAGLGDV